MGVGEALDLLEQANAIALAVWQALEANAQEEDIDDWLSRAINSPAGVIVQFWIHGLALLLRGKAGPERVMPEDYRQWFTLVVQDATSNGGMGRSLLASQGAFLFGLDEAWTRKHVIPLFSDPDRQKCAQAWSGFLVGRRLYPALVEALMPAVIAELPRHDTAPNDRRRRFIELCTTLAVFHVSDPTQQEIDHEVQRLLNEGLAKAREIVTTNRETVERIAKALMRFETLTGDDVTKIIAGQPIEAEKERELEESRRRDEKRAAERAVDPGWKHTPPLPGPQQA